MRLLATAWKRLVGPGWGSVLSYSEIAPHMAIRPQGRMTRQGGLQVVAADGVEVDVDAVRRGRAQQVEHGPSW